MFFEYDREKSESNLVKHGLSLEEGMEIWLGDVLSLPGKHVGERRTKSIGTLPNGMVVSVIWTLRGTARRLISARPATDKERKLFYDKTN